MFLSIAIALGGLDLGLCIFVEAGMMMFISIGALAMAMTQLLPWVGSLGVMAMWGKTVFGARPRRGRLKWWLKHALVLWLLGQASATPMTSKGAKSSTNATDQANEMFMMAAERKLAPPDGRSPALVYGTPPPFTKYISRRSTVGNGSLARSSTSPSWMLE